MHAICGCREGEKFLPRPIFGICLGGFISDNIENKIGMRRRSGSVAADGTDLREGRYFHHWFICV